VYYAPPVGTLDEVRSFLSNLPAHESPATFGLHENANITFQQKETDYLLDTVISVQPRASVSGGGKSSDEIVFDLANDMLTRIPDKIDTSNSHPTAFSVDKNGVPLSLSTVLGQEVDHFNNLLYVISKSLSILKKAVKGLEVMSAQMEEMYSAFLFQRVPTRWADAAYPSLKPLGPWVLDLIRRVEFFQDWVSNGTPKVFWLSGLHFPQGFLTAVLQRHARQFQIPIDTLRFRAGLQKVYNEIDMPEAPKTGIYVSGLFMEGARWDPISNGITESKPGELYTHMPLMWLDPEDVSKPIRDDVYECPMYKTATRAGALSTTGLSTNFVLSLPLSSQVDPNHWILRGVAMLCALPGDP
jgi:dynein heavy chain